MYYLGGAGAIEGVGLQNISTSYEEVIMDISNDIRTRDDQKIIIAPQFIRMILVTIAPEVLFCQPDHQVRLLGSKILTCNTALEAVHDASCSLGRH